MRKIFALVIICLLSIFNLSAQDLDKNELIGIWETKAVSIKSDKQFDDDELQKFEELKELMKNATFNFLANNNFTFTTSIPDLNIDKSKWEINNKTHQIEISSLKGDFRIMDIIYKKENDKIYFIQTDEEISLVFEVVKKN